MDRVIYYIRYSLSSRGEVDRDVTLFVEAPSLSVSIAFYVCTIVGSCENLHREGFSVENFESARVFHVS